jgi:hypothetical protein
MAVPNQERNQFKPGQSGNPAGREKGSKNRSTILTNTTRLNNEILKQRLSCIPIHITDLKEFDYTRMVASWNDICECNLMKTGPVFF